MKTSNYADEAPYHPGYEDAAMEQVVNPMLVELNEYRRMSQKYAKTQTVIVDYIRSNTKR